MPYEPERAVEVGDEIDIVYDRAGLTTFRPVAFLWRSALKEGRAFFVIAAVLWAIAAAAGVAES
ncbi:hypothetical protein ACIGZI_34595 [Streptomyces griseus]|uniref:hypothetical protein n=1 Tax=Streptomyces griseus TaxID=1911 RepID=UPI0037D5D513